MITGTQSAHQAYAESRFEMTALTASAHIREGFGTVLTDNFLQFHRNFIKGLLPGNPFEFVSDPLQGILQTIGIVLVIGDVQTFPADISFTLNVALVTLHLHDAVIFHFDLQAAVLRTKDASGSMSGSHNF